MEVYTSNWSVMFFESIDKRAHSIVPELDRRRMESNENPWPATEVSSIIVFRNAYLYTFLGEKQCL
jgi:diphthamide biosynthesis methyltransferase